MFADPQSMTVNATPVSLPRISTGDMKGRFRTADGSYELSVSHTLDKRERSVVRLDRYTVGVDTYDPSKMRNYKSSYYLVVDTPPNGVGFTDTEIEDDIQALLDLVAGGDFLVRFIGKEA